MERDELTQISENILQNLLRSELDRRMQVNASYSMRAFANNLGIESGALSRILSGKRQPNKETTEKILEKLGMQDLFEKKKSSQSNEYKTIDIELFKIISDWQHYAILELTRVAEFKADISWIAEKLDISEDIAQASVDRLFEFNMLEEENGLWKDASGYISTVDYNYSNSAMRNHQRQVLSKAQKCLDEVPFEERSQSSLTFTYDRENLEDIKGLIRKFEHEMMQVVRKNKAKNRVYTMSFSFFPVSHIRKDIK